MPKGKKTRKVSIPQEIDWSQRKIVFSFEYYQPGHKKYCITAWTKEQLLRTLEILRDVNSKNLRQLQQESRVYHFHEVHWEQTIYKRGFTNPSVNLMPSFQFSLIGVNNQLSRVYGAYYQGTFFIVWFDLNHEIWPTLPQHS